MPVGAGLLVALAALPVPDVELPRPGGRPVRLSEYAAGRPLVVLVLGTDCPVANLYGPRLRDLAARLEWKRIKVLAVVPTSRDDTRAVTAFAREHRLPFPCLVDADLWLTDALGATRTPQAFVLDAGRRVRYRGRIDDQYEPGGLNRGKPAREDLYEAAVELAAGRAVSVPVTRATGCAIARPGATATGRYPVTFTGEVRPIFRNHCQRCHRPGEVAPFALQTFTDAKRHAGTIAEVVADGRMPPWHASPLHGRFRNDPTLTEEQKKTIAEWIRLGCPEGDRVDPTPPALDQGPWGIGQPDAVYTIPAPFEVPAEGLIEYQHFIVDPGLKEDTWVRAAEVRPGNRRVVHHCNVFLQPAECTDPTALFETGTLGSSNLCAWTPGSGPLRLPPGMAKVIPAGSKLHFIVHYVTIGTPQSDQTELALQFAPAAEVRREVATRLLDDKGLVIPPHAAAHGVEMSWRAEADVILFSMFPHMHLRGKAFRYEAEFPDGTREVLLDVPRYDFNWQHRYELVEPRRLPVGTIVRCRAVYDNSAGNPANPDPTVTVRAGPQSTDEMFNGFFDIALADQDLVAERANRAAESAGRRRSGWIAGLGALAVLFWAGRMWRK